MTLATPIRMLAATAVTLSLALPATAQMSTRALERQADSLASSSGMLIGNPDQVAQVMRDAGYETERTTSSNGNPKLDGRISGWMYSVYFYGCDGNRCDAIQFAAGFDEDQPMDYAPINKWNMENRYGRSYLDDEGDPWVEMDINLEGDGVSVSNFTESLALWDTVLNAFVKHIGW